MSELLAEQRDAFLKDHPEEIIDLDGRRWGAIRAGDGGPALVLLPGTLGRADIFFHQIAALEGEARILSLTYPGQGTLEDWSGDVAELARRHGLEGALLLGSSLGGYVVQRAAAEHPDVFSKVVAANTLASTEGIDGMPPYVLDLDATPIADLRNGFLGGMKVWREMGGLHAELADFLAREVEGRIPEDELRARLKALKHAKGLPPQVLPPDQRVTVESGDDHLIAAPIREALRAALTPARAYVFEEGTHFPYLARPEAYTEMLQEVLGLKAATGWPRGAVAQR